MGRHLCAGCSSRPAESGESRLCTVCSGWKREVDDLAAVNAHHVDEAQALREMVDVCNQTILELAGKLRKSEEEAAEIQGVDEENHNLRLRVKELEGKVASLEEAVADQVTKCEVCSRGGL